MILTLIAIALTRIGNAQSNTFPSSGNVGIGTTTPLATLDVSGNIRSNDSNAKVIVGPGVGPTGTHHFIGRAAQNNYHASGSSAGDFVISAQGGENIHFGTDSTVDGHPTSRLTITSSGNVGVRNASPVHSFDVNGNIRAKGDNARVFLGSSNGTTGQIHFLGRAAQNNYHATGSSAGDFVISAQGGENIHLGTNDIVDAIPLSRLTILSNGNVGVGTTSTNGYKLAVKGSIKAEEIVIETTWSDFVFEDSYRLRPLQEVESHIAEYGHLPDVPPASMVKSEGLSLGEAQKIMMQKIEELTLYMIDLKKENDILKARVQELESN